MKSLILILGILMSLSAFAQVSSNQDLREDLNRLMDRCERARTDRDENICLKTGIDRLLDRRDRAEEVRCVGVNIFGKWAAGGGCGVNGCFYPGGGCNTFGCWYAGGSCGVDGCIQEATKTDHACTE